MRGIAQRVRRVVGGGHHGGAVNRRRPSLFGCLALMASLVGVAEAPPAFAHHGDSETLLQFGTERLGPNAPAAYGETIEFNALVSDESDSCLIFADCDAPSGRVDFLEGSVLLTSGNLVPITGSMSTASPPNPSYCCLTVGTHQITARYVPSGPNHFDPSEQTRSVTVVEATTTTSLLQSSSSTVQGQPVTFTATVTPQFSNSSAALPSGQVRFYDDGGSFGGPIDLRGNTATLTYTALPVGTHEITARYMGDPNHGESTSSPQNHTVLAAISTATALSAGPSPAGPGQPVTFQAIVRAPDGSTPTGTVSFREGGTTLGTGTLSGGVATFTTGALSVGTHSVTAAYGGAGAHAASTSAPVSVVVKACTITASGPTTFGTPGNDVICGSPGPDDIAGGAGDDIIVGGGGNDRLSGGDGNDTISGGDGDDQLVGDVGDDTLVGDAGTDYGVGGHGFDTCSVEFSAACEA